MNDYIGKWIRVIEDMRNSNTYKLAWSKGILECIEEDIIYEKDERIYIKHKDIVIKMLKYYWNQTFFFNLKQGPNEKAKPEMYQVTNQLIEAYKDTYSTSIPKWFNIASPKLQKLAIYDRSINRLITIANYDVSYRFLNWKGNPVNLYDLDKKGKTVSFDLYQIEELRDNSKMLKLLLTYKWAQLLEQYNTSPRIVSKVESSSKATIRRGNLSKFKKLLMKQYPDGKILDFYTGEILEENDITVDHVIPWSFLHSDDLWNLVLTSRSNNSSKSNRVIGEEFIRKLKTRNTIIYETVINNESNDSLLLKDSIDNEYVDRFYNDFKI